MKTLSILFYIIGSILLVSSCFVTNAAADWWLGGAAVIALIIGCICQFNNNRTTNLHHL